MGAFGLSKADLANLKLVKNYTDIGGTHHFVWAQIYRGIPAFDNQIAAAVTKDGRLVNVLGPAVANLSVSSTTPRISASDAVNAALRNLGKPAATKPVTSKSKSAT